MDFILIPADPTEDCIHYVKTAPPLGLMAVARKLVDGYIEVARYDNDAAILVNEDGRALGMQPNPRATRYAFGNSLAARQHHSNPDHPPYHLVGPVVIAGTDARGNAFGADLPERFLEIFPCPQGPQQY